MTSARAVVIFDGTFANTNWTIVPRPYGSGGGTGSGSQVLTGGAGDNGPARLTTNFAGFNNSGSYNASIYTPFVYSPAVSGPLTDLTISFDARYIDGLSALGGVVEQSGLIWFTGYAISTPSWQNHSFTPGSMDWYLINPSGAVTGLQPDFSASGAPIRFGYYTANGTGPGGGGYSRSGLVDNFTVTFVPAPSATALMGGVALFATRRVRRRD